MRLKIVGGTAQHGGPSRVDRLLLAPAGMCSEGGTDGRRDFYRDEALGREEVVLAALVDHSNLPVPLSILIRKGNVAGGVQLAIA